MGTFMQQVERSAGVTAMLVDYRQRPAEKYALEHIFPHVISATSKKMGGSENSNDDGEVSKVSPVGFGLSMGTSGDAGETIRSI